MRHSHNARDAMLFSMPFLIVYAAFLVIPIFYGLYLSFFDWNILAGKRFIGFQNFTDAFKDEKFLAALLHTCQFVLISTPATIIAGFLMSLIVMSASKLGKTAETIFFMRQATAVSSASAGRRTLTLGMARRQERASMGWCVGPSSPM